MKPLVVHNAAGEPRRLSALQIIGWTEAEIDAGGGRILIGTVVVLANGEKVLCREGLSQMDWLYERAFDRQQIVVRTPTPPEDLDPAGDTEWNGPPLPG